MFDQIGRPERLLDQHRLHAGVQSRAVFGVEVSRGDDNDRNVAPARLLLQRGHHGKPVHLRHHKVEEDHVGLIRLHARERLAAIRGLLYRPVLAREPSPHSFALIRVVFDQQHPCRPSRYPEAAHQPAQPFAVDRLGEITRRTERGGTALLVEDAHHDDRDLGEVRILPQRRQHRPTVEVRHHHVERDRDRPQLLGELEPFQPAWGRRHGKTFGLEVLGNQLTRG